MIELPALSQLSVRGGVSNWWLSHKIIGSYSKKTSFTMYLVWWFYVDFVILYVILCRFKWFSVVAIARPSVVCLWSVTFVRPTQNQIFGNISTALGTLAIHWHPLKISRRSSQGTPPLEELNTRGAAKYSDFGPIDGYISETVKDRR